MSRYTMPFARGTGPTFNDNYMFGYNHYYIDEPTDVSIFDFPTTPRSNNYLKTPTLTESTYSRIVIVNGKVQE